MTKRLIIQSCVGGGPMERLCKYLPQVGRSGTVSEWFTSDEWRHRMQAGPLSRGWARIVSMSLFPIVSVCRVICGERGVLVPTTNPFFLPGVMVLLKPLHRRPVVPLVYDLFPDALATADRPPSPVLVRLIAGFNRVWLARSDGLVFIGENMAMIARERYGFATRSAIIETGADPNEFRLSDPPDNDSDLTEWMGRGPFVSYLGNMGHAHDVDTLIGALHLLSQRPGQELRFLVAASGPGLGRVRNALPEMASGAIEIRFEEPLNDTSWSQALVASEMSIVTLKETAAHTSLPSKAFSAMAAGNAIIAVAPERSDLAVMIEKTKSGVVVRPGDSLSLANHLVRLSSDTQDLKTLQEAALDAMHSQFGLDVLARRWDEFLESLGL